MPSRLLTAALLLSTSALAQPQPIPGFELERFTPNPGARETLTLSTGDALPARTLRVSLLGHYEASPLRYTVDAQAVGAAVGYRVTAHLLAAYAFTSWAEVGLSLPVVLAQGGDDLSAWGYSAVPAAAMGAPWLSGRFTFLREDEDRPLDLAVLAALGLPLGSSDGLTKDPGPGLAGRVLLGAGRSFAGVVRVGVEAGVLLRGLQDLTPQSAALGDEVGSGFLGGLAVSSAGHALRGEVSFRGQVPFASSSASAELLFAVRYTFLGAFEVSAIAGPGFGRSPGTPAFRALLGFSWAPSFSETKPPEPPAP
ncbi:MAG: hypothetical protein IT380_14905 [Myxococcales bacterium]|nr:hypothetical protein [Myxococcales bacterium]